MYFTMVWRSIFGLRTPSDYGYTFILGTLELSAYPILIAINAWTVIGAWIGLKALAQWKVWGSDRATFNLFLIGNAINVLIAFFVLTQFVTVGGGNAPRP